MSESITIPNCGGCCADCCDNCTSGYTPQYVQWYETSHGTPNDGSWLAQRTTGCTWDTRWRNPSGSTYYAVVDLSSGNLQVAYTKKSDGSTDSFSGPAWDCYNYTTMSISGHNVHIWPAGAVSGCNPCPNQSCGCIRFTMTGLTNNACDHCASLNGTWAVSANGCISPVVGCSGRLTGYAWCFYGFYNGITYQSQCALYALGAGMEYPENGGADEPTYISDCHTWNPSGPNVMILNPKGVETCGTPPGQSPPCCDNWPATLTVTPCSSFAAIPPLDGNYVRANHGDGRLTVATSGGLVTATPADVARLSPMAANLSVAPPPRARKPCGCGASPSTNADYVERKTRFMERFLKERKERRRSR